MGRKQQVTARKLSASSYQLSAFAYEMRAFVSPLRLDRKGAGNLASATALNPWRAASGTPIRWLTPQPSGETAQSLCLLFDKTLPQCWRRWTLTPSASG